MPVIGDPTLCVNSLQRNQVFHCITWGNCPQLTLESKGNRRKRPWNIYEMWRIRPVGKHPWSDCRTWSGPTVPWDAWKATIRPWASVVFLIYISCCWRILLSSGKYCSLPKWIACGWQIAPALHSIWSEAAHALLPVFPHFHPWASIIPCPSCFLSRHWPFRWCLSWPPWPVAPLGAIMDSVLIACWRTEAVLHRLIADSLGRTDVCLCDRCSNAARLENQPSMCSHTYRPTQFSSFTVCECKMYGFG